MNLNLFDDLSGKLRAGQVRMSTPLADAGNAKDYDLVLSILKRGEDDVNEADMIGGTALGYAVHNNDFRLVEILLMHRADRNKPGVLGQPLASFAKSELMANFIASNKTQIKKRRIIVKGDSLEEAQKLIGAEVPDGHVVLWQSVISDGGKKILQGFGKTTDEAFSNAQTKVSENSIILERKGVSSSLSRQVTVEGTKETEVWEREKANLKPNEVIQAVSLEMPGRRGFLGIGSKPNKYNVDILRLAEVTLTVKLKDVQVEIEVMIDDDPTLRSVVRKEEKACDLCNKTIAATDLIVIPLKEMQKAVQEGWRPSTDDITGIIGQAGGLTARELDEHFAAQVLRDTSDWGICADCEANFRAASKQEKVSDSDRVSEAPVEVLSSPNVNENELFDSQPTIDVSVTNIAKEYLGTTLSFTTSTLPMGSLQIEFRIQCHGCRVFFTLKSSYEFAGNLFDSVERSCPHCTADLRISVSLTGKDDRGEGELTAKGKTHLRHQTPGAVGLEAPSITPIASIPTAELAIRLSRQDKPFPLELLEQLDDVNLVDDEGASLLSNLCYGHSAQAVKRAIEKGADPNHRSKRGAFPLLRAVAGFKLENVRALLEAGADVNRHRKNDGFTALHMAVYATCLFFGDERPQIAREIALLLLDYGADPNTTNEEGNSPLSDVERSLVDQDGKLKRRLKAAKDQKG